jgi:hypothetical protein
VVGKWVANSINDKHAANLQNEKAHRVEDNVFEKDKAIIVSLI